jgi:hypothetical protein
VNERRDLLAIIGILAVIAAVTVFAFLAWGIPTLEYILEPGSQAL